MLHLFLLVEFLWCVSRSPVFSWNALWVVEGCSESSFLVVLWFDIWMSVEHSFSAISSAGSMQSVVGYWNSWLVPSCGGNSLHLIADGPLVQNVSGLLGVPLLKQTVRFETGHESLVPWQRVVFVGHWLLLSHVVVRSPVHVSIGPPEEIVLSELLYFVVLNIKLGLGFKEHIYNNKLKLLIIIITFILFYN